MKYPKLVIVSLLFLPFANLQANIDKPAQFPLFAVPSAPPVMMINMSNDHQLYFKAYDDYSDLTGDGQPDTTYNHDFDYFGYFDSYKCYEYRNSRFEPVAVTRNKYCSGNQWSGNFLNWGTMTRMDIVRQILYGGLRSTDTETETVLERAFIPPDAHSFAKYYNGADIAQLTPFKNIETNDTDDPRKNGISFCNTTDISSSGIQRWSHRSLAPPLMRVARGNFSLWASNNLRQCQWTAEGSLGANNNDPDESGIFAYSYPPQDNRNNPRGLFNARLGEYNVRVKVCSSNNPELNEGDSCTAYPYSGLAALKPTGLLQDYGESGAIHFGLLTGSYARSRSGGALRRNVGSIADEINSWGGFTNQNESIITTLNRFRIFGFKKWTYNDSSGDHCGFTTSADGQCTNHGNPQAEILLESLRYLAGKESPISQFNADDSSYIVARDGLPALERVDWKQPSERSEACSPLNVLQFNTSVISHDSNDLHRGSDLFNKSAIESSTNFIGQQEGLQGRDVFAGHVGDVGDNDAGLCTAKPLASLSSLQGLCPQAPTQVGTYNLAGLARLAREQGLPGGIDGEKRSVRIFGVEMQPSLPAITIPYGEEQEVVILPVFRNMTINPNGARFRSGTLNDFRIVEQNHSGPVKTGTFFVAWDDSEHGNDHDVDLYGNISYALNTNKGTLKVESQGFQTGAWHSLQVGFSVSGTTEDGVFLLEEKQEHDAVEGCGWFGPCRNYPMRPIKYGLDPRPLELGVSSGVLPESPLYYAAKWGGYRRLSGNGEPMGYEDSYFAVTNPARLKESLEQVFEQAATGRGTAVNLASDGPGGFSDRLIYQTRFFSENWTGELLAYEMKAGQRLNHVPLWRASQRLPSPNDRKIFTYQNGDGVVFSSQLSAETFSLNSPNERDRLVAYLKGDATQEERKGGDLRDREHQNLPGQIGNPLGSFINSRPLFVSSRANFGHAAAENLTGSEKYAEFRAAQRSKPSVVYVGGNGGKLHAFNADTGRELFAYIPGQLLSRLKALKDPAYVDRHQYFVDGQIHVMDVYDEGWKRVLVGSLGSGGKGLFALDVTNPSQFSESDVLWEVGPSDLQELGYVLGKMTIAHVEDEGWVVIFGNGYASTSSHAKLFLMDVISGDLKKKIKVSDEQENGLSSPFVADLSRSGSADTVYAGDLHGNLWKFDLGKLSSSPEKIYQPSDKRAQPITVQPLVSRHPLGGFAIHFATGRYFNEDDTRIDIPKQRFVTIRDADDLGNDLIQQELNSQVVAGSAVRSLTDKDVPRNARGCYFELPDEGERVIAPLNISSGQMLMTTMVPEPSACEVGARSYVHNFNPYTCGRSDYSVYSDLQVSNPDRLGDESQPEFVPVSGIESNLGMSTGVQVQGEQLLFSGLELGEEGTGIDDQGRLQIQSRINEPGFRIWHQCQLEDGDDC